MVRQTSNLRQGAIIKLSFTPTKGREQAGYRPAVVISNNYVISKTEILFVVPITNSQLKGDFNIVLDERNKTKGAVLCAHARSIDLGSRSFQFVEQLPHDKLEDIIEMLARLVAPSEQGGSK